MASNKSKASTSTERPPAEQVARENYKQQFGTTKADAALPPADTGFDPEAPVGTVADDAADSETKEN